VAEISEKFLSILDEQNKSEEVEEKKEEEEESKTDE